MRNLSDVICGVLYLGKGYIAKDGNRRTEKTGDCLVSYTFGDIVKLERGLPHVVKKYIKWKGVAHLVDDATQYVEPVTFNRLSDNIRTTYTFNYFYIYYSTGQDRFRNIGFGYSFSTSAFGFLMKAQDYLSLADFLRKAGVKFWYDVPPWMEDAMNTVARKGVPRSTRRPGRESARFFGFS